MKSIIFGISTFIGLLSISDFTLSFGPTANFVAKKVNSPFQYRKVLLASTLDDVVTTNAGKGKTAVIAGATGYIGKAVVREAVRQGYNTVALVRDASKADNFKTFFEGAEVVECDVQDAAALTKVGHI